MKCVSPNMDKHPCQGCGRPTSLHCSDCCDAGVHAPRCAQCYLQHRLVTHPSEERPEERS